MGKMDSSKGAKGASGEKLPKGATASDMTGERKEKLVGGVAMGKEDKTGADKKFDGGRSKGVCYEHDRSAYR